jgi:hypothetical protein
MRKMRLLLVALLLALGPAAAKKKSPKIECAIVPNNCVCAYTCQQVWNGMPGPTCARACPNLDNPDKRQPPPNRKCGVKDGKCAFLD